MRLRTLGPVVTLAFSLAAPLAAKAQPAGRLPRIGVLGTGVSGQALDPVIAFRQGLEELGVPPRARLVGR